MGVFSVRGRKSTLITGVAPDAPDNVTSLVLGDAIEIGWDTVPGATSYRVYRNIVNNSTTATLINDANVVEYLDTGRSASTVYYYWVSAVTSGVESSKVVTSKSTGVYRTDIITPGTLLAPGALWNPSGEDLMVRFGLNPGDVYLLSLSI